MGQITANAVAYAAFRSAGGLKKCAFVAIAYGVLVLGFMFVALAINPRAHTPVYDGTARFLLGAQAFLLGGYACAAIINMIQKDSISRMMESHRLMPVDPRLVVVGYMFGAPSAVLIMVAFNFIVGGMLAGAAGLPIGWWVTANLVMTTFSIFAWSLAAAGAFFHPLLGFALLAPVAVVSITGGAAGIGTPPILLLASPCLGPGIFAAQPVDADNVLLLALSLALQVAVGAVFLQMAARRLRAADAPAMSGRMGIILVALLALAGDIVLNYRGDIAPALRFRSAATVSTMAMGALITLLVVATSVVMHHVADQQTFRAGKRSLFGDIATIAALCACIGAFAMFTPEKFLLVQRTLWVVAEMAVALTAVLLWARLVLKRGVGIVPLILLLLVFAFIPIMVSLMWANDRMEMGVPAQVTSQLSPMMMIPAIWSYDPSRTGTQPQLLGLLIQVLLLLVPAALLWRRHRHGMNAILKGV